MHIIFFELILSTNANIVENLALFVYKHLKREIIMFLYKTICSVKYLLPHSELVDRYVRRLT